MPAKPTPAPLTVAQAAAELGVQPDRVRKLINTGQLVATKFGRDYQIAVADLDAVRDRPRVGRPRLPTTPGN